MKKFLSRITLVIIALFVLIIAANSQTVKRVNQSVQTSKSDSTLFTFLVAHYAKSIDDADTLLASKLWSDSPEISFINPRGNEYGWNGVKNIIKMFGDNFSVRKLSCFDIKVANYGDFAWLEFHWVFDATPRINNNPVQTKGRETQIWRKIQNEWRLVHVHYSGMPVRGQGQGF
jgi:SnoaL-like domain